MDGNPCFPRPIVVCTCESIGNPIHWTIHQTFSALVTSLRQCRDTPRCASRCIGFVILRAFIQLECPSYKTTNPLYLLPPAQKKTCFASLGLAHSGMRVGFFLLGRDIRAYERPRTVANRHNSRGVLFMPTKEHSWSSLTYEQWQVMVLDWNALQHYNANPDTLPISTGKQNRKKYIDSIVDSNELGILRQKGT